MARQLEDCLALADRLGWEVVARYDDNDMSAFNGKRRPGFEALLADMERGRFDALLCWHTDRLYRSMRDLEGLIDIAEARRLQIRTVQGGDLDLSTSAGRMTARILGSVARQESEHKGERHRRANAQKAAAGKWQTANRPFGYTADGQPLEPEASMFRQAVADVLAGKSINQVAREWNSSGVRTTLAGRTQTRDGKPYVVKGVWNSPRVRRLLVNPRYAALKVHQGTVVGPGDWPALIDADTHRGLVAFLSDGSRVTCTSFERKYIGSGVYLCGICGAPMRHAQPGGKQPGRRRYECSARQCVVRIGEPLDELVEHVVTRKLREAGVAARVGEREVDVHALHVERATLQARLDELASLFAEGVLDASQLRSGTNSLRVRVAGVDGVLAEAARTSPVAKMMAGGSDAFTAAWKEASADLRGKVIAEVVDVVVLPAPRGARFSAAYVEFRWKN